MQHDGDGGAGLREGHGAAGPEGAWCDGEGVGRQAEGGRDWAAEIWAEEVESLTQMLRCCEGEGI